jgi:hypothetical protein
MGVCDLFHGTQLLVKQTNSGNSITPVARTRNALIAADHPPQK